MTMSPIADTIGRLREAPEIKALWRDYLNPNKQRVPDQINRLRWQRHVRTSNQACFQT